MSPSTQTTTFEVKQVSRERTVRGKIKIVGADWCVIWTTVTTYGPGDAETSSSILSRHGADRAAAVVDCAARR